MSSFALKGYQSDCLKVLESYLRLARERGAKAAFNASESRPLDALKRSIPGYGQINQSVADPIFGDDF